MILVKSLCCQSLFFFFFFCVLSIFVGLGFSSGSSMQCGFTLDPLRSSCIDYSFMVERFFFQDHDNLYGGFKQKND